MRHELLPRLVCPACRRGLRLRAWSADAERVSSGHLQCPACAIVTPIVDGFVLFTEPLLHPGQAGPEALAALGERLFGPPEALADALRARRRRGACEVYAAFQPFNEAMRVIEPLLPWLGPRVQAGGGAILDLWCRTGWSAQWLAGCFPDTPVVAMWEGAHSVLGYKGWRHLMGPGQRRGNLDVVFSDPRQPLPFADAAFSLVYSHDVLHRYGWQPLAGESLRVTQADGALLHTHLHLRNSEPEPFFERGCQQEHGRDWRAWLDGVEAAEPPRRGWVLGESEVFDTPTLTHLADAADTPDYNGLLLLLPAHADERLRAQRPADGPDDAAVGARGDTPTPGGPAPTFPAWAPGWRQVLNPLMRCSAPAGEARVHPAALGGTVAGLLRQHPVYQARLPAQGLSLDGGDWALLALCAAGLDGAALRACVDETAAPHSHQRLARLNRHELLHAAPVDRCALHLQNVHALQADTLDPPDADPQALHARVTQWLDHWAAEPTRTVLRLDDGDGLSGTEARHLIEALQQALRQPPGGTAPGALRLRGDHPLLDLLALAAALAGCPLHWTEEPGPPAVQRLPADPGPGVSAAPWQALGADGDPAGLLAQVLADASETAAPAISLKLDTPVHQPAAGLHAPLHHWLSGSLLLQPWVIGQDSLADARVPGWLLRWGRWQAEALGWDEVARVNAGEQTPA